MIEHVLIAVGNEEMDTESVGEHVAEIVTGVGADVTLFRAYTQKEFTKMLDELGYDSAQPEELAKRHMVVNELADVLRASNVKLNVAAQVGPIAESVVDYVQKHDVDHVFLGGRRRSPAGKALLGSVSQQVLLDVDAPCTIMLDR